MPWPWYDGYSGTPDCRCRDVSIDGYPGGGVGGAVDTIGFASSFANVLYPAVY